MRGFTLIEVLVSVAIFTVVMVMALGALLALSAADRRAESLKAAVNSLNFALDSMSRDIRTGYGWGCNASAGTNCTGVGGAPEFVYTSAYYGQVLYKYDTTASDCGQSGAVGCIARSVDGGSSWASVTAPDVVVTGLHFYLVGAPAGSQGDTVQPKLTVTVDSYVQVSATEQTPLNLQTTITQRLYDQ